ncbi:exonuclease domain-containing protein [Peredibacter starrii]|uniref:Exonuclease domain-containing protein n=1 Tax=Peredibacter starrii TaxID=28202 RepID=A0AAX4HUP7_9BACT|nr:exonuclease domain-containing protein [Peredibacter starrii]WPU66706.1 exonuclease domain-containing protein [Peredibacter starrii]
MSDIVLPPKYYLDHFEEFIREVKKHHSPLMEERHHLYLADYDKLVNDSKCLLIRMINRSGKIFDKSSLIYEEIEAYNWEELRELNLVRSLEEQDLLDYLNWLKKDDFKKILLNANIPFKKSASREELLTLALNLNYSLSDLGGLDHMVVLNRHEEIDYLLFLYFGKLQNKLILPTLRDLGIRQSNKKGKFVAKFQNKEEAFTQYFYAHLKQQKRVFTLEEIETWPTAHLVETKSLREELLLKSAQKTEDPNIALSILKLCQDYPATTHRARLLHQLGFVDECLLELERMMDDPNNDEELLFAEDFLQRKYQKKRLSLLTETLRNAESLSIDESFYRHPEFGVLAHYENGHFAENYLWNTLFWTFFQEQLEDSAHSEFDYAPPELVEKTFFAKHEETIFHKFKTTSKEDLKALFAEDEILLDFIEFTDLDKIFQMLAYMAQDFYGRSSGFPDLFIIENNEVSFIEVKAEGDSLRPSQIKQMRQLEKVGFKVKVLQVNYKLNPQQTYVVVDLETTGSLSSWNRVTEIGAVKIQNGQVIDTFQTLINPERSIPQSIQELTGITNEMVKDAPTFSGIVEKFLDFMDGSIFVAHNAGFDYGFIQNEFARLEERFVMPYICTKAWMRKYYPGLPSYGLKNLCQTFNISLESHHRALCDATAAAHLLNLINQKRS